MSSSTSTDQATAQRLRSEWEKMRAALKDLAGDQTLDPLGEDGPVTVKMKYFKANGGGEVLLLKGQPPADHRYTRFRAWGTGGADFVEKTSYLVKANGVTEFHKRRAENGDQVFATDVAEGEDKAWTDGLK